MSTSTLILLVAAILLYDSFVIISPVEFGVVSRLGNRRINSKGGRTIGEGFHLKLPLIDQVQRISGSVDQIEYEATFPCEDNIILRCTGVLHFRRDRRIVDKEGRCLFVEVGEETFASGVREVVEATLGAIGGQTPSDDFKGSRDAVKDILNCLLRLSKAPHLDHDPASCPLCSNHSEKDRLPKGESIGSDKLLQYYKTHWKKVEEDIKHAEEETDDFSGVEGRYGLDIKTVTISDISYTADTERALEKRRQAELRVGAFEQQLDLVKKAAEVGIPASEAIHAVQATLDDAKKIIVTTQGGGSVVLVDEFLFGNRGRNRSDREKDDTGNKGGGK